MASAPGSAAGNMMCAGEKNILMPESDKLSTAIIGEVTCSVTDYCDCTCIHNILIEILSSSHAGASPTYSCPCLIFSATAPSDIDIPHSQCHSFQRRGSTVTG